MGGNGGAMVRIHSTAIHPGGYDHCVFVVAEGLNAKHGLQATHLAAEYAERAQSEGDRFGADFWHDVMRAIEAADVRAPHRVN